MGRGLGMNFMHWLAYPVSDTGPMEHGRNARALTALSMGRRLGEPADMADESTKSFQALFLVKRSGVDARTSPPRRWAVVHFVCRDAEACGQHLHLVSGIRSTSSAMSQSSLQEHVFGPDPPRLSHFARDADRKAATLAGL